MLNNLHVTHVLLSALQIKCAQYWPQKEEKEMFFEDTNFTLTLISEDVKSYYTVRQLELENLIVSMIKINQCAIFALVLFIKMGDA